MKPDSHKPDQERGGNDRVPRGVERSDPRDDRSEHRAGKQNDTDHKGPRDDHHQAAGDLDDAREIPKPLAEADLIEDPDPRSVLLELTHAHIAEQHGHGTAKNPSHQGVDAAWLVLGHQAQFGHGSPPRRYRFRRPLTSRRQGRQFAPESRAPVRSRYDIDYLYRYTLQ